MRKKEIEIEGKRERKSERERERCSDTKTADHHLAVDKV